MSPDLPRCILCASVPTPRRVGTVDVVVCPGCGLGRTIAAEQAHDYWALGKHDCEDQSYWTDSRAAVFGGALELLEAEVGGGRILDLGGGVGHFAELALRRGWDAYSVDVSQVAVAAAAKRIGLPRSLGAIPDELSGTCDAVTLWCVVAHVSDPQPMLAEAARALRPGGRLFLTTPNFRFQTPYARMLARLGRPIDFSAHDHLLHFTHDSLGRLLGGAGLPTWSTVFVGVTEECVADPRLSRFAVPGKRLWNRAALRVARAGLPYLGSEFQVLATRR